MPFADIGAARDAIYTFMVSGLATQLPSWTPIIIFDNKQTPAPPDDQRPYMRVQLRHTDRNQRSIGGAGGRRFRAKFQVTCKVYTMLGVGADPYSPAVGQPVYPGSDVIAQALMNIFQGKTTGTDQAQFYHVRSQEYGEDEGRYRTNVLINGDYDTIA